MSLVGRVRDLEVGEDTSARCDETGTAVVLRLSVRESGGETQSGSLQLNRVGEFRVYESERVFKLMREFRVEAPDCKELLKLSPPWGSLKIPIPQRSGLLVFGDCASRVISRCPHTRGFYV